MFYLTYSHFYFFIFLKIYLFLERGGGREKERERNTDVGERYIDPLPLTRPQLGTWPTTQACVLTWNRTSGPLVCRLVLSPLSHPSQGPFFFNFTSKAMIVLCCTSPEGNDDNNDDDYNDDNLIQLSQKGDVLSFIKCQQKSVFSF